MKLLRQSTASQEVPLGTFVDDTDGKTAETGLTIANTDIKLWKEGATSEVSKNSGGATHMASGRYYTVLDATDTNTVGNLDINVSVSGALPVKVQCFVLHANVYDFLIGSNAPSSQTSVDAVDDLIDTEVAAIKTVVDAIKLKTDNLPSDPADASDIADSFTTVNTKLDTIDDLIDTEVAAIKTVVDAVKLKTDNLPTDPADASDIVASFTTVNNTLTTISGKVDTVDDLIDTEVAAIKTVVDSIKLKTDNLPSDPADASDVAAAFTVVNNTLTIISGKVDTVDDLIDTEVAAIKTVVDAVKVVTDRVSTMYVLDGAVYQFTSNALELAPTGGGGSGDCPTVDEIVDEIDARHGAGSYENAGTGTGARTVVITVTDTSDDPLENVKVRLSQSGVTHAFGTTDTNGQVTLNVDDGTYTVALTKAGQYQFAGTTLVVNSNETATYEMTLLLITASEPEFVTGYSTVYGADGLIESNVTIYCKVKDHSQSLAGFVFDTEWREEVSNEDGLVQFTNLIPGVTYLFKRGSCQDADARAITIPSNATTSYQLKAFKGKE